MRYIKHIIIGIIILFIFIVGGDKFLTKRPIDNNQKPDISSNSNIEITKLNEPPTDATKVTVVRYVDGDTIKIKTSSNKEETVRLLLVDTPETKHPKLGVQKYGSEASDFTKENMTAGETVYIEHDKEKYDKYDRMLAYVWYEKNGSWVMLNEELVSNGLARVGYVYKSKKYLNQLLDIQKEAEKDKLNIWSKPGYVTDKGYNMSVYN